MASACVDNSSLPLELVRPILVSTLDACNNIWSRQHLRTQVLSRTCRVFAEELRMIDRDVLALELDTHKLYEPSDVDASKVRRLVLGCNVEASPIPPTFADVLRQLQKYDHVEELEISIVGGCLPRETCCCTGNAVMQYLRDELTFLPHVTSLRIRSIVPISSAWLYSLLGRCDNLHHLTLDVATDTFPIVMRIEGHRIARRWK